MVSLLKVDCVQYRCSCDVWLPPCHLYFCRKCDKLKCALCVHEEMDVIFCPNCLESSSGESATAQGRKYVEGSIISSSGRKFQYRCDNCNYCPMCANILVVRGVGNGLCYGQCTSCHWTTRDANLPDQTLSADPSVRINWPEHINLAEARLDEIAMWMKEVVNNEKIERDRRAQMTKRLSNMGVLSNDRYSLSAAYNLRRKALNTSKTTRPEVSIEATADVPELDLSVFTTPVIVDAAPTLEQILRQPLRSLDKPFYPAKVKLISRRFLRCNEHDTLLYRCEFNCYAVKPKIACFAFEIVPEVRISRPVEIVAGQAFSLFLIVSNNAPTAMKVLVRGDTPSEDPNCVDCSNFEITLNIPNRDNVADIDDYLQTSTKSCDTENEPVVVIKRHRYGIRVDCKPLVSVGNGLLYAPLVLSYSYPDETPNKSLNLYARINLYRSAMATES